MTHERRGAVMCTFPCEFLKKAFLCGCVVVHGGYPVFYFRGDAVIHGGYPMLYVKVVLPNCIRDHGGYPVATTFPLGISCLHNKI